MPREARKSDPKYSPPPPQNDPSGAGSVIVDVLGAILLGVVRLIGRLIKALLA
jgi:hypothetical protein